MNNNIYVLQMEIKKIERNGYNSLYCFEDCIATIANYENRNYELMFLNSFLFDYNNNNSSIFDSILLNKKSNIQINNLKKYHGIEFVLCEEKEKEKILNRIECELKCYRPIVIYLDTFYCYWDVMYEKRHSKHMAICTGFDRLNSKVYLMDPFYNLDNIEITEKQFLEACSHKYYRYEIIQGGQEPYSLSFERGMLDEWFIIEHKEYLNYIDKLKVFAKEFKINYKTKLEFSDIADMLKKTEKILDIVIERNKKFNAYLFIIKEDEMRIQKIMEKIIGNWIVIKNMLFKDFFKNSKNINEYIYYKISDVIENEKALYDILINNKYNLEMKASKISGKKDNKVIATHTEINNSRYLDIEDYFNNNSFSNINNDKIVSDFSGINEFIGYNKKIPEYFEHDGVKLKHKIYNDENNDNIVCKGQIIVLNKFTNLAQKIYCVAVSEFGETIDKLVLKYKSGKIEEIYFKVSDINEEPKYEEQVVWRGSTYIVKDEKMTEQRLINAHLFSICISLHNSEIIESIQLPMCENLHLYAITLC